MSFFNAHLSNSDISTISACLSILPDTISEISGVSPIAIASLLSSALHALETLSVRSSRVHSSEISAIYSALYLADMVNQGDLIVDADVAQICRQHRAGIEKLLPLFENHPHR